MNIDKHTSEPITDEVVDRIVNEDSHRIKVTTLLSYIQRLAVGSQHNIYDQDVLWDLSGSSFINVYENYRPYMNRAREDNVLYYLEADEFIEYLKTRSKQKNEELRSLE